MVKQRTYSMYAKDVTTLMGMQIKLGRKNLRWTEQNLADKAGISRATLQKIERGEMSCAIGLVFEVATLVGVKLFAPGAAPLSQHIQFTREKIAQLPQRIKPRNQPVHDEA